MPAMEWMFLLIVQAFLLRHVSMTLSCGAALLRQARLYVLRLCAVLQPTVRGPIATLEHLGVTPHPPATFLRLFVV